MNFEKKAGVDNKIELILSEGNEVLDDFINRGQKENMISCSSMQIKQTILTIMKNQCY